MRPTIDFGVDLGTTNSAVAVLNDAETQVVKNGEQMDYTPSAVWLDSRGKTIVGRSAKERADADPDNVAVEFKLKMGTPASIDFQAAKRSLSPEELSTEVLKSLRKDVAASLSEDVQAAVITVPAAFELPQCDATKRAAKGAGFEVCPLITEPVAAGIAYGFQTQSDRVNWLVFDLGGGTFDAAVIRVQDGEMSVVNHAGDNHLGGKFLDWDIVTSLLIPEVVKQEKLPDFQRGNDTWRSAISKLKGAAEAAKIKLSRDQEAEIFCDDLADRDGKRKFEFQFVLKRAHIEMLFDPMLDRAIAMCHQVLRDKKLGRGDLSKVLLVGGPTLTPYLRERLKDSERGLGATLDFRIDPLTVVARGAAIFAGTQRLATGKVIAGPAKHALQLEYSPMGPETEPLIGGRLVSADARDFSGFTIEFINHKAQPAWRSGPIGLSPKGTFHSTLWAEKGHANQFAIEVHDGQGRKQETDPAQISYTVSAVFTTQPLIHSLGVGQANNQMAWFFKKGTPLPAKNTKPAVFLTTVEVRPGADGQVLHAPVMEGENERADRNQEIGRLTITGEQVRRTIPAGSEIEVHIEVDASRIVTLRAYVPLLDEEFHAAFEYEKYKEKARVPGQLRAGLDAEIQRLNETRAKADRGGDTVALSALQHLDSGRVLQDAEKAAAAAGADQDEADRCEQRILELKVAIDKVEEAMEWPQLVVDARAELERCQRAVNDKDFKATADERADLAAIERDLARAIDIHDADLVRSKAERLSALRIAILKRQPGWWVALLQGLEEDRSKFSDQAQANTYFDQAGRAIQNNDIESLRTAVRQLFSLLPPDAPQRRGVDSGVIKYS